MEDRKEEVKNEKSEEDGKNEAPVLDYKAMYLESEKKARSMEGQMEEFRVGIEETLKLTTGASEGDTATFPMIQDGILKILKTERELRAKVSGLVSDHARFEKEGVEIRTESERLKKEFQGLENARIEAQDSVSVELAKRREVEAELSALRQEGGGKGAIEKAREKADEAVKKAEKFKEERDAANRVLTDLHRKEATFADENKKYQRMSKEAAERMVEAEGNAVMLGQKLAKAEGEVMTLRGKMAGLEGELVKLKAHAEDVRGQDLDPAATLECVLGMAVPSLNPDDFTDLERIFNSLARTRGIDWQSKIIKDEPVQGDQEGEDNGKEG